MLRRVYTYDHLTIFKNWGGLLVLSTLYILLTEPNKEKKNSKDTNYMVRQVLIMVAPVGSERRCLIRHLLKSFDAITNIYKANNARSAEERVEPRNPCHILQVQQIINYSIPQLKKASHSSLSSTMVFYFNFQQRRKLNLPLIFVP